MTSPVAVGREAPSAAAWPLRANEVSAVRALVFLLAVLLLVMVWQIGATAGLLMLAYVCALCLPGLPMGFMLFGRWHPAGWISGALFGYVSSASAFWLVIRAGAVGPLWFIASWVLLGTLIWAVTSEPPLIDLPQWKRRDAIALILTLLLVPAILWRPFTRIGEQDSNGGRPLSRLLHRRSAVARGVDRGACAYGTRRDLFSL